MFTPLCAVVSRVWALWELLMLAEPLMVVAPTPGMAGLRAVHPRTPSGRAILKRLTSAHTCRRLFGCGCSTDIPHRTATVQCRLQAVLHGAWDCACQPIYMFLPGPSMNTSDSLHWHPETRSPSCAL